MRSIFEQSRQVMNDFSSIETERRRIQYNLIFLIGAFFLAAFSLASYLSARYETAQFLTGCLAAAVAINVFILKTESHKIAAWLYSTVLLVLLIYLILSGGVERTGPLWSYPILVIIISILGHLHGFFLSLFVVAVMSVILGFGDSYGLTPQYSETFKVRFIATMFALTALVWCLEYSRARAASLLNSLNQTILDISRRDQLTGLLNRRGLEESFNSEVNRTRRMHYSFCLAVLDIDDFKLINDQYGHLEGDEILKQVASLVESQIRNIDTLARWGGEEFVILIDQSTMKESQFVVEKIRSAIENMKLDQTFIQGGITISAGLAEYTAEKSMLEVFDAADNALYLAKNSGKNCVKNSRDVDMERRKADLMLI